MPPKNKGKSKTAAAKPKAPTLIDGLTKEQMSKEQLKEHIVRLREELDREREERNYFQLERDKIQAFWEVTKRQLGEAKAEIKTLDKDVEEDERRHQAEVKVYKQKMKHLLCEHHNMISELRADALVSSEAAQKEQQQLETKLLNDKMPIMVDIQELDIESIFMELELKHKEEMKETKSHWEKKVPEAEAKYEAKIPQLVQDLDKLKKVESREKEIHWRRSINDFKEQYLKDFNANMDFRKELLEQNLENKLLRIELDKLWSDVKCTRDGLIFLKQDSKDTVRSMAEAEETISTLKKEIAKKLKVKGEFAVGATKKEMTLLKQDIKLLEEKYNKLQLERDELYKTHMETIEKVEEKATAKSEQLEKQLEALTDGVEATQARLSAVLSAPNVDQTALREIAERIEEKLDSSNKTIKDLQSKKAQIAKARVDLLLAYEAKLRAVGFPVEVESCPAGRNLEPDPK